MKNNKGFTLVELIVSITLISVVLMFLYQILINLKQNDTKSTAHSSYQITATYINETLQNNFINKSLTDIVPCTSSADVCYLFSFSNEDEMSLEIYYNTSTIAIISVNKKGEIINYEKRAFPDAQSIKNIFIKSNSITKGVNYSYYYDSLFSIKIVINDSNCDEYYIETYYPYSSTTDIALNNKNIILNNTSNTCN